MTREQYVDAMLKIAFHAGCVIAEKEAQELAGGGPVKAPYKLPAAAQGIQAPPRGPSARSAQVMSKQAPNLPARPQTRFQQPGPKVTMGARTPGKSIGR